ncbi:hypothetical protein BH23GEM8_BH23GEM8_07380 [soil metagenome]
MFSALLRGTAALLVLLLQLSCSDGTEASPVPATVQLSASTLSVADGESSRLIATVLDQSGAPLTSLPSGVTIDWSSSDPSIASVTGGYVTGNRPGSAEITVSVGTASASASVTVTQVARSLERVLGDGQSGVAGEKLSDSLKVRVIDRHGDGVAGIAVAWEVSTGDGGLEGVTTTSNSHGHARASWRLGGIGGTQIVIARLTQTGGATMFSATAVGGPDAPFITAVSPAVLVPGETATITGGNFDLDVANLKVSVAGLPVTVLSVAAEQLTVQMPARTLLPCNPVGDTSIGVTSRGFTAIEQHPLKAAIDRNLVVGESLILQGAADLACNGLPAGRYMLSTFYTSRSVGATATVDLRGSAGPGAAFSTGAGTATAAVGTSARGPLRETAGADAAHDRVLNTNREILRTLAPRFRERRELAPTLSLASTPAPGDTLTFRVPKTSAPAGQICSSYDVVRARVVYKGPRTIVFEDVAAPLAGTMDDVYHSIGREYEETMHDILLANFGNPLALGSELSNAEQVYMLFSSAVNNDNPNIAGFVFSGDLFPREQCASSDRAAIFYAVVPTAAGTGRDSPEDWRWSMRSTVIHEVKHITSFAERLNRNATTWEESWLEESTARISEELWARRVFGYQQRGNVTYQQSIYCEVRTTWPACSGRPYVMLKHFSGLYSYLVNDGGRTPLGSTGSSDASFYGSGWSLVRWALDQSTQNEGALLQALTQETQLSGVQNLEARAGRPLEQILPLWSLSLAVSGLPSFAPQKAELAFPSWNLVQIFSGMNEDFAPVFPRGLPQRTSVGSGSFQRPPFTLRGGSAVVFDLQNTSVPRAIQLRGPAGANLSALVGVAIVRVN